MSTDKSSGDQPSIGGSGECRKSVLDFNSIKSIDMRKFSMSELYSLSQSTSDDPFDPPENDVTPNVDVIKSSHRPTCSIFTSTNSPRRIFAFSHRQRASDSNSDDVALMSENELILNPIQKLISSDDSSTPVLPMQLAPMGNLLKKRRKWESENEFEGLGIINVNGEAVDLNFLACAGDKVFGLELKKMTEGMMAEDEFIGVIRSLDGRWSSNRKRRKYVDAESIVKVLPDKWKILLSLRPRARQPALYCREFFSPLGIPFKSCKEVAFYLKSVCVTNNANSPEERAVMLVKPTSLVDLECGASIHSSSNQVTDNRMGTSKSIVGLDSPLQRLGNDTLNRKHSAPRGLLIIREPQNPPPKYVKHKKPSSSSSSSSSSTSSSCSLNPANSKTMVGSEGLRRLRQKTVVENKDNETKCIELKYISTNREGSSSSAPKNDYEMNWNLKTICFLCLVEFIRKPVDPDTLPGSPGFICPKCKEASLTWLTQCSDN